MPVNLHRTLQYIHILLVQAAPSVILIAADGAINEHFLKEISQKLIFHLLLHKSIFITMKHLIQRPVIYKFRYLVIKAGIGK